MKLLSILISLLCSILVTTAQARPVTVFAASSMTNAIDEILDVYQQRTGIKVLSSYAASSSLARQIASGAPADIYISANQRWMDYVEKQQLLLPDTRQPLAGNQLVLISQSSSTEPVKLNKLPENLQHDRLSIADPAHVPAGLYAKQALQNLTLWQPLMSRLANAQNVRSALLMVERGEAPYGIVYQTDARLSKKISILETIDPKLHDQIIYPLARLWDSLPESEALYHFLLGAEAQEILIKHGFTSIQGGR